MVICVVLETGWRLLCWMLLFTCKATDDFRRKSDKDLPPSFLMSLNRKHRFSIREWRICDNTISSALRGPSASTTCVSAVGMGKPRELDSSWSMDFVNRLLSPFVQYQQSKKASVIHLPGHFLGRRTGEQCRPPVLMLDQKPHILRVTNLGNSW